MSRTDPDARIAKLKDGRTRLAYKPEHVVDLETGAIVAAVVHGADVADPASVEASLTEAEANLQTARGGTPETAQPADAAPTPQEDDPPPGGSRPRRKVVADKGYHKADPAPALEDAAVPHLHPGAPPGGPPPVDGQRGHPDGRRLPPEPGPRTCGPSGKRYHRWRAERTERTFAHVCETGGARRTRLRGRANVAKRYLLQAAGANLALVMRTLYGLGTPRGWADRAQEALLALLGSVSALLALVACSSSVDARVLALGAAWGPPGTDLVRWPTDCWPGHKSTGC